MDESRFRYLFNAYFNKTASASERDEFMQLLLNAEHDDLLKTALDKAWYNVDHGEHFISKKEESAIVSNILGIESNVPVVPATKPIHFYKGVFRAAAIILLIAGAAFWFLKDSNPAPPLVARKQIENKPALSPAIKPGADKAVLTLGDGSTITLDSSRHGTLARQGNANILKVNSASLSYQVRPDEKAEVVYNTLSTPNGGQYQLILPDGSKVWLNASSSIRFPTAFTGPERRVSITGEAYFEVEKKRGIPFKISVNDMEVSVLGTHFNIMAYGDESSVNTTLLEGAVRITRGNANRVLASGQESRVKNNGAIQVVDADIEAVMAWKNGWFQFNGYDIEKVMRQVSRWYNVEVEYEGKIPEGHFSGAVSRGNDIQQVLKILEGSGIHFRISGNKLTVIS